MDAKTSALTNPADVFEAFGEYGSARIVTDPVVVEEYDPEDGGRFVYAAGCEDGTVCLAIGRVPGHTPDLDRSVTFVHLTAASMLELMELVPNDAPAPLTDDSVIGRILTNDDEG